MRFWYSKAERFRCDRQGNFAVIVALSAVPLVGLSGLAVDYSRSLSAKTYLQDRSDAMSLAVASLGPEIDSSVMLASMIADAKSDARFGTAAFLGSWTAQSDYTVKATSKVSLTLGGVIPGVSSGLDVSTTSVARYIGAKYVYKPPEVTTLDPEASDYNRISAYCYDPSKSKTSTKGRTQMTDIADNASSPFTTPMPQCLPGEMLSFKLYNARDAKANPKNWYKSSTSSHEYFTDTILSNLGAEQYDLDGKPILETVMCPSLEKCTTDKKVNGVLPSGKKRSPQRTTEKCGPGKYMYYGWEDRVDSSSDRDYDDIRVIIACPEVIKTGDENVRLIR